MQKYKVTEIKMKTFLFILILIGFMSCNLKQSQNQDLQQRIQSNELKSSDELSK